MVTQLFQTIAVALFENITVFGALILALFLGLILGLERTIAGRVAGMRTYALVSLGACLLIVISETVTARYLGVTAFDPLRVAAGIIMGIGFLAGGLIIFHDSHVTGLTTAAGVWVSTGIGIAVGFRLYALAIFTTLLTLFVFSVLWYVEQGIKRLSNGS